jgi:hypothetical protein
MPDWLQILSSLGSLMIAGTGLYIAVSTRRKNEGDAALSISSAAEKTVALKEKDILALNAKIDNLYGYVEYLWAWIDSCEPENRPMSLDEYLREKKEARK